MKNNDDLVEGMMIGFAFVAPIGMQNLYVFNNAMNNRLRLGRSWPVPVCVDC